MKNLVNFKNSLITFFAALLLVVVVTFGAVSVDANTSGTTLTTIFVNEGFTIPISVQALGENLSSDGTYTATFRVSEDWYVQREPGKNVSFNLFTEKHVCKEGNGNIQPQGFCGGNMQGENTTISLNQSNGYAQTVTFTTKQNPAQACGSFQTDLFYKENGGQDTMGWSWMRTGVDCQNIVPSPSPSLAPSPSPSIAPSPSPSVSPSPSTVQCPVGQIQKIENSTVVCVAQNQNQNQTQTQNNNQNQTVNQNVNATGGSSSSSSSSSSSVNVTVNNPTPAPSASPALVNVVSQVKGETITQLPKTGLPLAGLLLSGLLPAGFGLKRFSKKNSEASANSIWMEKQLI